MVLKRIWSVEDDKGRDVLKLARFKEYKFKLTLADPGHYHFVCGLPHSLNIDTAFTKESSELNFGDKLHKLAVGSREHSLKLKLRVFNKYVVLLQEKKVISLKGGTINGEVHIDFEIKPKYVSATSPITVYIKLVSHSLLKKLKIACALYKDADELEKEKDIMRMFLRQVFDHGKSPTVSKGDPLNLNTQSLVLEELLVDPKKSLEKRPSLTTKVNPNVGIDSDEGKDSDNDSVVCDNSPAGEEEEDEDSDNELIFENSSKTNGGQNLNPSLSSNHLHDSSRSLLQFSNRGEKTNAATFLNPKFNRTFRHGQLGRNSLKGLMLEEPSGPVDPTISQLHANFNELSLTKKEVGKILLTELFTRFDKNKPEGANRKVIDIHQTSAFKDHIRNQTEATLRRTILHNLVMKYPRVKFELAINPYKDDNIRASQIKEDTLLTEVQMQILNYECLPKALQYSTWIQRYNSTIFGHNLNEIIRLCCTASEPQMIIIQDEKDYIFGGLLMYGLYMKNNYNKDAALDFPSVYHANFSLANYDISTSYSEIGAEGDSFVFSFFGTVEEVTKFPCTQKNRMFRMINQTGLGMGGGGSGFAWFIDSTLQYGASNESETYGNIILSSAQSFGIKNIEVWGLQSGFNTRGKF